MLIQYGANVNVENKQYYNETPLYASVRSISRNTETIIKELLAHGANINVRAGLDLNTPLHQAIGNDDPEIVKLLLNNGARRDIEDRDKKTPLALAQESENLAIKKLFGMVL